MQKTLTGPTLTFIRKKKRGMDQKISRLWLTSDGYRLIWRKEVYGVRVPARFQACVRVHQPGNFENGYTEMWDFVNHKRPLFKTAKAAIDECERHKRIWSKACQCPGVRSLKALFNGRLPTNFPIWARSLMDQKLRTRLCDCSPGRVEDTEEPTDAPLPEPEPELTTEGKKRRRRKIKPAAEPAAEPKKRRTRSDKGKKRGPQQPATEPKKRRTRSDKGKKRGPRQLKETT